MQERNMLKWIPLAAVVFAFAGWGQARDKAQTRTLTLATTTSTRDSGLLKVLVPMFKKETGIDVKVVAVGSGQALELGRRGDADVLLTHAPDAEKRFMAEGYGERRRGVMHNDFVLVGPQTNPARIKGRTSITRAFDRIAQSESPFISRGDESGTHMKEKNIWKEAALDPAGNWYVRAGVGMAQALRIASEKRAYTLADRGTFLSQRDRLDLAIHSQGDPLLRNPYAVIVVSSAKHPGVNHRAANRFAEFLLSPKVQSIIGKFGVERFGQPLYFPRMPSKPSD
jgi:tungstate transport system substrate-binding protein